MSKQELTILSGVFIENEPAVSLDEVLEICHIKRALLDELIAYGIIEPIGEQSTQWQFTRVSVQRTQKALRLQRDLDINWQGIALAIDLLDELERLRQRVKVLEFMK